MLWELLKIDFTGLTRPKIFKGKPIQNYKFTRFCIGSPVKNTGLVGPVKSTIVRVYSDVLPCKISGP